MAPAQAWGNQGWKYSVAMGGGKEGTYARDSFKERAIIGNQLHGGEVEQRRERGKSGICELVEGQKFSRCCRG